MARVDLLTAEPIGLFYAWWRGDPLPALPAAPDLIVAPVANLDSLAVISGLTRQEIDERLSEGHRPWLAWIAGQPAGYGWVATERAGIGELGITIHLPAGNRYLWNFVTRPEWRGRGIYSHLLQAMIQHDAAATRFWIGHDVGNVPSARGIIRAGFRSTGTLYQGADGAFILLPEGAIDRAAAAAALLDVPLGTTPND